MNELEKELNDYLEFSFSESVWEVDFLKIKEIILKFTDKLKIDLRILKNKLYDLIVKHLSTLEDRKYKVNVKNINDFLKFIEDNNDEDYIYFKLRKILWILNNKIIFFDKINLYKFDFDKNWFNECEFLETISFSKWSFKKDFKFHNCIFKNNLKFVDCKFEWRLEIINCKWFIQISSPKWLKNTKIWNNDKNKLSIKINNIKFNKEWDYFFWWKNIESIEFNSTTNLSDYFKINKLNDVNLNFINADLWKTTFNWVSINKLYLENATLNDCVFNWVEFPKDYKLEKWKLSNKQLKDNYRQLKFVMDKNWNKLESNNFFVREMNSYYDMLSDLKIFRNWKTIFNDIIEYSSVLWDKIVLWVSKTLNNFWSNWIINLIWLFIFVYISTYTKFLFKTEQIDKVINSSYNIYEKSLIYHNLFFQLLFLFIVIILLFFISKWFIKITGWLLEKMHFFWLILIFIGIYYLYWYKEIFDDFLNLLINPLYGFKDLLSQELKWIELLWFIIYKIFYIIIMWHLIIALKRTTKR